MAMSVFFLIVGDEIHLLWTPVPFCITLKAVN